MANKFERILCPVDFSQESDHALRYAHDLAERVGGKLVLVHVLENVDYLFVDGSGYVPQDLREQLAAQARERLGQLAASFGDESKVDDMRIVQGAPFEAIRDAAEDSKADLVVMGTHGRTGFTHMLLGSVAEKVVRTCPVPVVTVRRPED